MIASRLAPAPPTTSRTSWNVHSVVQSLTRTVRIFFPHPPSLSAATMFLRAPGLASGAHASSRSRNTWSAGRPLAFSRKRGLLPGTARLERRDRSSATVPPLRVRSLCDPRVALLPESSDGVRHPRPDVTDPSGHQIGLHLVHPVDRQPGLGGVLPEAVGVRRLLAGDVAQSPFEEVPGHGPQCALRWPARPGSSVGSRARRGPPRRRRRPSRAVPAAAAPAAAAPAPRSAPRAPRAGRRG